MLILVSISRLNDFLIVSPIIFFVNIQAQKCTSAFEKYLQIACVQFFGQKKERDFPASIAEKTVLQAQTQQFLSLGAECELLPTDKI